MDHYYCILTGIAKEVREHTLIADQLIFLHYVSIVHSSLSSFGLSCCLIIRQIIVISDAEAWQ